MRMRRFAGQLLERCSPVAGSEEQIQIWDKMACGDQHLVVNAVAGSGKSFTCLEGARRLKASQPGKRIVYLAFNKSVQVEMQAKGGDAVQAMTFHSLGYRALRREFPLLRVNNERMWAVVDGLAPLDRQVKSGMVRLGGLAKQYGWMHEDSEGLLQQIIERHSLDFGTQQMEEEALHWTPQALEAASRIDGEVDFDDMIWLPFYLGLGLPRYDLLLSDESQDLNPVQQWMALHAAERVMVIGDPKQSIYGFRGADVHAIDNLAKRLPGERIELPLSYTRRCPHSHVKLAQAIAPQIKAPDSAPQGQVGVRTNGELLSLARPGDLVLCRVNAPLIETAYKLVSRGVKATILGREIADGILHLVDDACGDGGGEDLLKVLRAARLRTEERASRFLAMPNSRGQTRAAAAYDRLTCLVCASQGCQTTSQLRAKLQAIFDVKHGDVRLGTIHKVKGLEADRVWILQPNLLPHPMAAQPWEREQEMNCLYVALTRAKQELWFVDGLPPSINSINLSDCVVDLKIEVDARAQVPTPVFKKGQAGGQDARLGGT